MELYPKAYDPLALTPMITPLNDHGPFLMTSSISPWNAQRYKRLGKTSPETFDAIFEKLEIQFFFLLIGIYPPF